MKGIVSIYEKPGCKGDARLKKAFKDSGYVVQALDLLSKKWSVESLSKFFAGNSPSGFINERAPQITSGEFVPGDCSDDDLYDAMIASPILIKRPLLFFRGEYGVGSDCELVSRLLPEGVEPRVCDSDVPCN